MAKETYPKVAAEGTVKACNKKKGCTDLKFDDLNFTGHQFEQLSDWVDQGIKVRVTVQQVEGMLIS